MNPIPLFGSGTVAKSTLITAQRRVNCLYEIRVDGDKSRVVLIPTPGSMLFVDLGLGPVRGGHTFTNKALTYVVAYRALWEIGPNGVATNRGVITAGTSIVAMEDNGTQLLILDGTAGWIFTPGPNTLAQVTDANFPDNATTVVFDSGFFLVNDPSSVGRFRKSAIYDGTTWPSADLATSESSPDQLVGIKSLRGTILCFGALSLEYWQIVGGSGFPYTPLRGSTQDVGLAAVRSMCEFDNSIVFLGRVKNGPPQVFRLEGLNPVKVSDVDVDSIISKFSTVVDAIAFSFIVAGHSIYQITFPTANRTFIYDGSTSMWSERQTGVALEGKYFAHIGWSFEGMNLVGDTQSGRIYEMSMDSYTDNGVTIPRIVQTRHQYNGHNVLGVDELFLDIETGVGVQSGQGSNPQIALQISKDNGKTFGLRRLTPIGKVGQYAGPRAIWRRLGTGRDFVYRFTLTDPVKFMVSGGAATVRIGKS